MSSINYVRLRKYAWIAAFIGQPLWLYVAIVNEPIGPRILCTAYALACLAGLCEYFAYVKRFR